MGAENCIMGTTIALTVLLVIATFALSVVTWVRLDDNQGAKNGDPENDFKQPWFCLLFLSIFSVAGTIIQSLFMSEGDDGKAQHNWFTRMLQIVPLAMWIWLIVQYDDASGFKWDDFDAVYPRVASIAVVWIWFVASINILLTLVMIGACIGMTATT